MLRVYVPVGVLPLVLTVSAEEPEPPLMGLGAKDPEAPEGKPNTLRLTLPENPFNGATVAVYVVDPP